MQCTVSVFYTGVSVTVRHPAETDPPVSGAAEKYAPQAQPSYASLEGFINAKVLAEAIRRAGADPSRAQVARALDGMNNFDLGDVSISFSKTNHQGSRFVGVDHDRPEW